MHFVNLFGILSRDQVPLKYKVERRPVQYAGPSWILLANTWVWNYTRANQVCFTGHQDDCLCKTILLFTVKRPYFHTLFSENSVFL
jgi:hypothetical protein